MSFLLVKPFPARSVTGLALLLAAPAATQSWAPEPTIPGRTFAATAWDGARQRIVLFGGNQGSHTFGGTWECSGRASTRRHPARTPSARWAGAMAFDTARRRTVLFGGMTGLGAFNDTWEWDGHSWVRLQPAPAPPPLDAAMAYDAARRRVVLFSGGTGQPTGGTWEWDGSTWTPRMPAQSPPAPLQGHRMAYDSARQRIVLFGGYPRGDLWEWDGTSWTRPTPPLSPPPTRDHAMAHDTGRGVTVVFGGMQEISPNAWQASGDTWEWDGAVWRRVARTGPPALVGSTMVFDAVRKRCVLLGGSATKRGGNGKFVLYWPNDLWEWDGVAWSRLPTPEVPAGHGTTYMVSDLGRSTVVMLGAFGLFHRFDAETWEWSGGRWRQFSTSPGSATTRGFSTPLACAGPGSVVGLYAGPAGNLETWEWNGTQWTQRFPARSPGVPLAIAGDFTSRALLVAPNRETWVWDGTNWTRLQPTGTPPDRAQAEMAFDAARARWVLFGGYDSAQRAWSDETWEFDGVAWRRFASGQRPSAGPAAMAWDPNRGAVVVLDDQGALWTWTGVVWVPVQPADSALVGARIAFDPTRGAIAAVLPSGETWHEPRGVAVATTAGAGCGAGQLRPFGLPWLGEPAIGMDLSGAAPNAPLIWIVSALPAQLPIGLRCSILVDPAAALMIAGGATNGSGFDGLQFGVPRASVLIGRQVHGQVVIGQGGPLAGAALTNRVELTIGG